MPSVEVGTSIYVNIALNNGVRDETHHGISCHRHAMFNSWVCICRQYRDEAYSEPDHGTAWGTRQYMWVAGHGNSGRRSRGTRITVQHQRDGGYGVRGKPEHRITCEFQLNCNGLPVRRRVLSSTLRLARTGREYRPGQREDPHTVRRAVSLALGGGWFEKGPRQPVRGDAGDKPVIG